MRIWCAPALLLGWVCGLGAQAPSASPGANSGAATPADDLTQAHDLLERDKVAEALVILEKLAADQPPVKGVQHELGLAYYRTGKLVPAKTAFAEAASEDPNDLESVQMEGFVLYRLGQPAQAIPYLEKVRHWMPNADADANHVLGLCYLNSRRYDDARRAFATQYDVDPASAGAYLLFGSMLMQANLPEMAAEQARKALTITPNLPLAHFMEGEVALYKSDVPTAITEFEAERAINPDYAPVYDRLGDAYLRGGRAEDAQKALTKAISLDTSNSGSFILMGKVLLRSKDTQTAILYLKHAEKMDPGNYIPHSLLAQAYRTAGEEDEAKREMDLTNQIHSANQLQLQPVK
jgi:tetratricopeptide (TPR) repeat protein